jgi:hypothetical protein
MTTLAEQLATWAYGLVSTDTDRELAACSLVDTIAVTLAAHEHPITRVARHLSRRRGAPSPHTSSGA